MKMELASLSLSQESFKMSCGGVVGSMAKEESADTLR
jgi:hypothetical protein